MRLLRRQFLRFAAAGAGAILASPRMALASAPTDRRFVFIIQRGAADGLNIVIPYGDPEYAALRREIAIDPATAIKLNGHFALNPAMPEAGRLFAGGEALFVHATASPYRDRSHFDGQNVLETGGAAPYAQRDGWMNRLVRLMPRVKEEAIAFAPTVPLALRGAADVASFAPSGLQQPTEDLLARVGRMYQSDPQLHSMWQAALAARDMGAGQARGQKPADLAHLAATFLSRSNGPRIAMLETGGWDTHSGQQFRLTAQLRALDTMIGALRDTLGPVWNQTTVLVATEFGRTAAVNGTGGTDHGTASVAMLFGGGVNGGRVIADWPGLSQTNLYEQRDLKPTIGIDAVIAGAAAETFGIDPERLTKAVFPTRSFERPLQGLIRL